MSPWSFWSACLAAALLAPLVGSAAEQPNVVILLADDLGWADVGHRGSDIETPNLDALAAGGIRLDRLYAAPIFSPTRAALLTGRDPLRLGMAYFPLMAWSNKAVSPKERFLSQDFKAAPSEKSNVADANPERVADLAERIRRWRATHPVAGQHVEIAPHPGWRSPKDWSTALLPADQTILETGPIYQRQEVVLENLQKGYGDRGIVDVD